jgi:uncharacterized membrane protein YgaE (UPF0421/DUF939 family)
MMIILENILKDKASRQQLIAEFQELIWNEKNANELLAELAYDLDFYEPNEELRKQDSSYYGDDQLEEKLRIVVKELKQDGFSTLKEE